MEQYPSHDHPSSEVLTCLFVLCYVGAITAVLGWQFSFQNQDDPGMSATLAPLILTAIIKIGSLLWTYIAPALVWLEMPGCTDQKKPGRSAREEVSAISGTTDAKRTSWRSSLPSWLLSRCSSSQGSIFGVANGQWPFLLRQSGSCPSPGGFSAQDLRGPVPLHLLLLPSNSCSAPWP